jgi:hypothetical protein
MSKTVRYSPDTHTKENERRHLKRKLKQERTVKLNRKKLEQDERDYR